MGVTLDLRIIDHERIAVQGLRAVNDAIRHDDPERLRQYLTTLPVEIDPSVVEFRKSRLYTLRDLKAPEIIIQNEEKLLRVANGEVYRPAEFRNATFDELRQLLGTWCWITYSYSLDKAWDELHWFLEPSAGPDDFPLHPVRPKVGDHNQTVFCKALQGAMHYAKDDLGDPVIRTLGSSDPDCSGYNPPDTCEVILAALEEVDTAAWEEHVPFRSALLRRSCPDLDDGAIADWAEDELALARDVFPEVVAAYSRAVEKGYGVSCEYSL
jgi:hypothetical protein